MADYTKLAPFICKWEGGDKYTDDPVDRGGATKYGITLETWKNVGYDKNKDGKIDKKDVMLLSYEDFLKVFKKNFWDKWQGDKIKNQSVANIVVDWLWGSGKWGIIYPQRILGVKDDGKVGPKTIEAINKANPKELFNKLKAERIAYVNRIVKNNPSQKKFINGWKRRINAFTYDI